MKKIKILSISILVFSGLLLSSCKDKEKSQDKEANTTEAASAEEMKQSMSQNADLKYNPEHGVEGHRCDLPVGAPLEKATASPQKDMSSSPVRLQSATPKVNPPHGEPGHDCSVPVGAQLDS